MARGHVWDEFRGKDVLVAMDRNRKQYPEGVEAVRIAPATLWQYQQEDRSKSRLLVDRSAVKNRGSGRCRCGGDYGKLGAVNRMHEDRDARCGIMCVWVEALSRYGEARFSRRSGRT